MQSLFYWKNIFVLFAGVNKQVDLLDIEVDKFNGMNTAEKCLYTSKLLGDIYGIDFWTVAIYYLQVAAAINEGNRFVCLSTTCQLFIFPIKKYTHLS